MCERIWNKFAIKAVGEYDTKSIDNYNYVPLKTDALTVMKRERNEISYKIVQEQKQIVKRLGCERNGNLIIFRGLIEIYSKYFSLSTIWVNIKDTCMINRMISVHQVMKREEKNTYIKQPLTKMWQSFSL